MSVATGDNIFGLDATDAAKSLDAAFSPAVMSNIPWAAVLGNHDQESTLSREGVMKHIVNMKNTLSLVNPPDAGIIDGFGNYNLEVAGVSGSQFHNKSVLNLYFLDSGDYSTVPLIPGYGWIKASQQSWFLHTFSRLKVLFLCLCHNLLRIQKSLGFRFDFSYEKYHLWHVDYLFQKPRKYIFSLNDNENNSVVESIHGPPEASKGICSWACVLPHSIA